MSLLDLIVCPRCRGPLTAALACAACKRTYSAPDGIPDLRVAATETTERVRHFYEVAPFPGYPPRDTLGALRARAERSAFIRRLDAELPAGATIAEIGCGTGQTSLYLAKGDRRVVGVDVTQASLRLAAQAARRFGLANVAFVGMDLLRPGLRPGAFDMVYCAGVLHHTADPEVAFAAIVPLARPGGLVVVGLYNTFARLPLRLRRLVARATGYRVIPFDPVLRARAQEPDRALAWTRDQYRHPEEHRHSLGEVQGWFRDNGVEYLRAYPSALLGGEEGPLLTAAGDNWALERGLAQLAWIRALGHEGGLFMVIGRRTGGPPNPVPAPPTARERTMAEPSPA